MVRDYVMEDKRWKSWNSPVVFLLVTALALVIGSFYEIERARVGDAGYEFDPIFTITFSLGFAFAWGILGTLFATLIDLLGRRRLQPLAYFNFSVAFVMLMASPLLLDRAFGLFGGRM
jgi:hypothetical protein